MGYGDAIYAAGVAEKAYRQAPQLGPVAITDCHGKPRWRDEWAGNPAIFKPKGKLPTGQRAVKFGGHDCLPYHPWHRDVTWRAQDHRGRLYLSEEEQAIGQAVADRLGPFVLLEPGGLERKNPNRYWPSWPALMPILSKVVSLPIVQLDRPGTRLLEGTIRIPHQNFRQACAIVRAAKISVLTEGGLTAGAAALDAPAIVLYGGNICSDRLGYPEHVNFSVPPACWRSHPCDHCAGAWTTITPIAVAQAVVDALARQLRGTLRA